MEDQNLIEQMSIKEVYNKPERKRELIKLIVDIEDNIHSASKALETKAWELLRVASATFGIVATFQVALVGDEVNPTFWLMLIFVLMCYIILVYWVIQAVRPHDWQYVPGTENHELVFESLLKKYVYHDENEYLDRLIVDHIGKFNGENNQSIIKGALQKNKKINDQQANAVRWATYWLVALIGGLILMAIIAVLL